MGVSFFNHTHNLPDKQAVVCATAAVAYSHGQQLVEAAGSAAAATATIRRGLGQALMRPNRFVFVHSITIFALFQLVLKDTNALNFYALK